jgi:hypothetical protein
MLYPLENSDTERKQRKRSEGGFSVWKKEPISGETPTAKYPTTAATAEP